MSSTPPRQQAAVGTRPYRAIWRWHFYAGLIGIPFLLVLATSGLTMIYGNSVEPFLGRRYSVEPGGDRASPAQQALAAQSAILNRTVKPFISPDTDRRASLGIAVVVSAVLPLTGLSIIAFAAIDLLLPKRFKEAGLQNA
jgi:uncharacterized iron-regulated membrane protein